MNYGTTFLYLIQIVGDEISALVDGQKQLESKFEQVLSKKTNAQGDMAAQLNQEVDTAVGDLRNSTHVFARGLKQSPLTPDNMYKVQEDRSVLSITHYNIYVSYNSI